MADWVRPRHAPINRPTEEEIWDEIERSDPHQTASVQERLYWHQDMLEGRDIFSGFFRRSPLMPIWDSRLPEGHNPVDWIITLRLRHAELNPFERIIDSLVTDEHDVLQPAVDEKGPQGSIPFLGYRILNGQVKEWKFKVFGNIRGPFPGYYSWAKHVLMTHGEILKKAGVYQAIYSSLFSYKNLSSFWACGLVEHWDPSTNTCWVGPNEMTLTLWELQAISGLPILGVPYEECIPPDVDLFRRNPSNSNRRGESVYPDGLYRTLMHYHRLCMEKGKGKPLQITLHTWIKSFLRPGALTCVSAQPTDPFCLQYFPTSSYAGDMFEPILKSSDNSIIRDGIDGDSFLIAFIATWLCHFIFPTEHVFFRPESLLMASMIASGVRVSIAPAVLAYIYRGLGIASRWTDLGTSNIHIPWQYIYGWIHIHVSGAFSSSPQPDIFERRGFPTLMRLIQAIPSSKRTWIHMFFFAPHLSVDRFGLIHRPVLGLPVNIMGKDIPDLPREATRPAMLSEPAFLSVAEYFINLRPAWLCYRSGSSVLLEGYHPNRAARQFGYSQIKPLNGLPTIPGVRVTYDLDSISLDSRLQAASFTWAFLLRLGTGSHFRVAPPDSLHGIGHLRLSWIRHTFSSFFERGTNRYVTRVQHPARTKLSKQVQQVHTPSSLGRQSDSSIMGKSKPMTDPEVPEGSDFSSHNKGKRPRSPSPPVDLPEPPLKCRASHKAESSPFISRNSPREARDTPILDEFGSNMSHSPHSDIVISMSINDLDDRTSPKGVDASQPEREVEPTTGGSALFMSTSRECSEAPAFIESLESSSESLHFISIIPVREVQPCKVFQGLHHLLAALKDLIVNMDMAHPPGVASFCNEANVLLDAVASLGLEEPLLRQWETSCREMEFCLYRLHSLESTELEDSLSAAQISLEKAQYSIKDAQVTLNISLQILKAFQDEASCAHARVLHLTKKLDFVRKAYLFGLEMKERASLEAVDADARLDHKRAEVEKAEHALASFVDERGRAHHRLEALQRDHATLRDSVSATRARAAALQMRLS